VLTAICHTEGSARWEQVDDLDRLSDLRATSGTLLWAEADIAELTEEDVQTIAEEFELHPLAVEDAVHVRQRPKFESYDKHMFLVLHQLDTEDGQLEPVQIACFIGERYVLTIHAGARRTLDEAKKRWESVPEDWQHPAQLAHTLLDVVVDDYQEIADDLEVEIEELEDLALELEQRHGRAPGVSIQRRLYSVKQRVGRLRRYVFPGTRLLEWVIEPGHEKPFSDRTAAHFRDVYDHLMRITEQVRNVDDLASAVLDLVRSHQAEVLNEINKKLAAWAAIFAIGTLIAGIYGMNFALVPEDQTLFGFWFAVALMVVCSIAAYINFKKRDWL
jgi:magnesium transporter